jgi:hypothetical protein
MFATGIGPFAEDPNHALPLGGRSGVVEAGVVVVVVVLAVVVVVLAVVVVVLAVVVVVAAVVVVVVPGGRCPFGTPRAISDRSVRARRKKCSRCHAQFGMSRGAAWGRRLRSRA